MAGTDDAGGAAHRASGHAVGGGNASGVRPPAFDRCFEHHGRRYGLDAELLRGVARVESGMRPEARNNTHIDRTGTRDIGLMQINTSLLPKLAGFGIREQDLMDPCTNIEVGAWVLADAIRRHGDTWQAVGAYNAACTQLKGKACTEARSRYAWAVYKRMGATPSTQPATLQIVPGDRPVGGLVQVTLAAGDGVAGAAP